MATSGLGYLLPCADLGGRNETACSCLPCFSSSIFPPHDFSFSCRLHALGSGGGKLIRACLLSRDSTQKRDDSAPVISTGMGPHRLARQLPLVGPLPDTLPSTPVTAFWLPSTWGGPTSPGLVKLLRRWTRTLEEGRWGHHPRIRVALSPADRVVRWCGGAAAQRSRAPCEQGPLGSLEALRKRFHVAGPSLRSPRPLCCRKKKKRSSARVHTPPNAAPRVAARFFSSARWRQRRPGCSD